MEERAMLYVKMKRSAVMAVIVTSAAMAIVSGSTYAFNSQTELPEKAGLEHPPDPVQGTLSPSAHPPDPVHPDFSHSEYPRRLDVPDLPSHLEYVPDSKRRSSGIKN